jgi:hypothetical protein
MREAREKRIFIDAGILVHFARLFQVSGRILA